MGLKAEIAIVSAFGRGHWLAAELAKKGIPVVLLDVTPQLGSWAPEDWEGPFGFFKSGQLKDSQVERLLTDDPPLMVSSGLTLWLEDGPLELKGPTALHRLQYLQIPEFVQKYVAGSVDGKSLNMVRRIDFSQNWLAHLSHSFSSVVLTLLPESMSEGKKQDFFSSFFIRQGTRLGLEKSFKWCEAQGVQILRDVEIKDLSFRDKKTLEGFEIRIDKPGLCNAEKFVWCLSSEETGMLGSPVQKHLFPAGAVEPEWVWVRYRLRFDSASTSASLGREQLPLHCILIQDLYLNWVLENMIVLQRTSAKDHFDAWIRIANGHRFQRQYLEEKAQEIIKCLKKKLPEHEFEVVDLPQEATMTFNQLGPARHALYSRTSRSHLKVKKLQNVEFDSPEQWECLGWEGGLQHQQTVFEKLEQWWNKKEELRKKREAKEQARLKRRTGADL